MTPAELDEANAGVERTRVYFESLFERRRAEPGDDLTSALLAVRDEDDGRLSADELASNISLLFAAGHETTANLIGNGLLAPPSQPRAMGSAGTRPRARNWCDRRIAALRFLRAAHDTQGTQRLRHRRREGHGSAGRRRDLPARRRQSRSRALRAGGRAGHHAHEHQAAVVRWRHPPLPRRAARAPLRRRSRSEAWRNDCLTLRLDNIDSPEWRPTLTLRRLAALPASW